VSRHQKKQASMYAPRFGTQSKLSSKQPYSRGMKAPISIFTYGNYELSLCSFNAAAV